MDRSARRDDGEMPVFDADAPVAGGVRRGPPGLTGRRSGSARGVGLAVGAIVLLTAGVAAGGLLEPPSPSASALSSATSSDGSLAATDGPCIQAPLTRVPSFVIGVEGASLTAPGRAGYSHRPDGEEPGPGWIVPGSDSIMAEVPTGAAFEIRTSGGACVRHILAAYASALFDHPAPNDVHRLKDTQVGPPAQSPTLGVLPDGDWVLRVLVHFETGDNTAAGLIAGERFFRVLVGPGPFPTRDPIVTPIPDETPAVTPAVPCNPAPSTIDDIAVVLTAPRREPVVGVPDGSSPPVVDIGLGDAGELVILGDVCATSWHITRLDATTGTVVQVDAIDNLANDPAFASQNHWRIAAQVGTFDVIASLHLGPGLDVVRIWRVVSHEFTVPETLLRGADGAAVAALPGCGLVVQLTNGYSNGDGNCVAIGYPAGLEELHVPAWSVVALDISGWTLSGWNGQCGRIATDENGQEVFEWSCSLGGFSLEGGVAAPGPARFLARPGSYVVQLWVNAANEVGTYNVPMFALVAGD